MADDRLAMTPRLQAAIRMLQLPNREVTAMIDEWRAANPGVLADLAPGEADPLDESDRIEAMARAERAWRFLDEVPLPALATPADVLVFGNPPQVRANPAALPRVRAVFDDDAMTKSATEATEAAWYARSLRQRAKSFERVVAALVARRPQLAIALDPSAVEPVAVAEIATATEMHESTIERVCGACVYQTIHGAAALGVRGAKIAARPV